MRQNLKDYYDLKLKEKMDQLESAHHKATELDAKIDSEKKNVLRLLKSLQRVLFYFEILWKIKLNI